MAAPTIQQIMEALEERLKTIDGLQTSDFVPGQVNPPHAMVGVPDVPEFRSSMGRGVFTLEPTITVVTSKTIDRAGQHQLASYVDPASSTSIAKAVEADRRLGNTVQDCIVLSYRSLTVLEVAAIGYYGGVFNLRVIAAGV